MLARLTGKIESGMGNTAIVDVNGVGYLVQCSSRTLTQLQGKEIATLHIETQVREDAITLFGFLTRTEQDWFRLLTTVQGVGGKAALAILSVLSPDQLNAAILSQDKKMITQADGVGPKLAERICNELKGKVGKLSGMADSRTLTSANNNARPAGVVEDAISALINLGFPRAEAFRVVQNQVQEGGDGEPSLSSLIQNGLKQLSA